MGQKKVIDYELKKNEHYQRLHDELVQLYIKYLNNGSSRTLDDIVRIILDLHNAWAKKNTFNYDEEQDLLVVGATKAFKIIVAQREKAEDAIAPEKINSYVHQIFKNELIDIIRKHKKGKTDEDLFPQDELSPISLDRLASPSDPDPKPLIDTIPDDGANPYEMLAREEKAALFHDILVEYCRLYMNRHQSDLKHTLSLFYARVLPHNLDAISDYVATSPKWAWTRMKDHSFLYLTDESESMTKEYISTDLAWCTELRSSLERDCPQLSPPKALKKTLAREIMDQGDVGHWSTELHNTIRKELFDLIQADSDLVSRAKAYIENTDRTFGGLLYGGK